MEEVFPTLYLLGNTIYMKGDCWGVSGVDGVIVNVDMHGRMSDVVWAASQISHKLYEPRR